MQEQETASLFGGKARIPVKFLIEKDVDLYSEEKREVINISQFSPQELLKLATIEQILQIPDSQSDLPTLTVESVIQADQMYANHPKELLEEFKQRQPQLYEFLASALLFHDSSESTQIQSVVAMVCKAFAIQMGVAA